MTITGAAVTPQVSDGGKVLEPFPLAQPGLAGPELPACGFERFPAVTCAPVMLHRASSRRKQPCARTLTKVGVAPPGRLSIWLLYRYAGSEAAEGAPGRHRSSGTRMAAGARAYAAVAGPVCLACEHKATVVFIQVRRAVIVKVTMDKVVMAWLMSR
jgi:hypothetical protein